MASTVNLYPNLPGHLVEFKDGGLALRDEPIPSTSDSVLILGTATDGPVQEPVAIDMSNIEALFGKDALSNGVSNGATLVRSAKQLHAMGVKDIRVMRVTGSQSEATIAKDSSSIVTYEHADEQLGLAEGNVETTFTLANEHVVAESVRVYANGVLLPTGFSVEGKVVTLHKNACNAGVSVQISYSYQKEEILTDAEFVVATGSKVKLPFTPESAAAVTIKNALDVAIDAAAFSVAGATITFKAAAEIVEGATVKVSHTGIARDVYSSTETGTAEAPFQVLGGEQLFTLANVPFESIKLYADGVELSPEAYIVTAKEVMVKQELVTLGCVISASYTYAVSSAVTEEIKIKSLYGGEVYNQGAVAVRPVLATDGSTVSVEVVLTKPISKRAQIGEAPLVYSAASYPTFGQLVDAINNDAANNVFVASTDFDESATKDLKVNVTDANAFGSFLTGGEDGVQVTKQALFEALSGARDDEGYVVESGAYQLLEDYSCDWVIPVGVYADDKLAGRHQNFAYELALFCAVASSRNKTMLGFIGMKPCSDTSLAGVQAYAQHLATHSNVYPMVDSIGNVMLDGSGSPIDLGKFISVVGGPDVQVYTSSLARQYAPAALAYAACNIALPVQAAPTNKQIQGVSALKFRLSNKQHNDILGNRIVTLKIKNDQGGSTGAVCAVDGVTAALPTSDYTRLSTAKVIRETVDQVRMVSEPYIGQPNTIEQRNSLSAAISKRLGLLQQEGILSGYEFAVNATQLDQVLGQCSIELTIIPPQELRKITTVVGLKA